MSWFNTRRTELALAFALLTRLPTPRIATMALLPVGAYVWAFPLAGLVVGALGGIALWLVRAAGVNPSMAALAALAVGLLATGALHEDGLADFWDGIGGGRTRERKLEIMRDSAIGSFGAAALFISLAVRWSALAAIADPGAAIAALIVAHTASRGMLALVLEFWRPARKDGQAAATGGTWISSAASVLIAAAIGLGYGGPALTLAGLLASAIAVQAVGQLAGRQLGGYTGDVLGTSEQTAECLVLAVASSLLAR